MNLDFITQLWPGAQRVPANVPPAHPPERSLDERWQLAGTSPAKKRQASGKRRAKARQPSPPLDGVDAVILALIKACRASGPWKMLSVTELAEGMGCSVGEASKRVKQATDGERFAWAQRQGRQKLVSLHRVSAEQWHEIVSSTPMRAVGLYRLAATRTRQRAPAQSIGSEARVATP